MITLLAINKAVNNKVKAALSETEFSEVKLVAEDLVKGIKRPSIKVAIETSENGKFNSLCREKRIMVRIHFFASDRYNYKLENTKMQDLIENAFIDGLEVEEGFYIPIDSVESEVSDTVLVCSFELYAVELLPDTDNSEPMEEIYISQEVAK